MNLVNCPACDNLCFTDCKSCAGCGREFQSGTLQTKADAEDKAFMRKSYAIFLVAILILLGALVFVVLGGYSNVQI